VSYGGPVHTDVVVVAEVQELFSGELRAIVGDDGVWDPESMDDVGEGLDLDPLGEFVDGDQQVREAPGCLLQGTDEV
jgi:hypothetical protein